MLEYPKFITTNKNLIIYIIKDESFFEYVWSKLNIEKRNDYDFIFLEKNDSVLSKTENWKNSILFYIDDLKNEYDYITVIGPNTFFELGDNSLYDMLNSIYNILYTNNIQITASLILEFDTYLKYIMNKDTYYEFEIFNNFYNQVKSYLSFDFFVMHSEKMRFHPSIFDFYDKHLHEFDSDLFSNSMFNNEGYSIALPLNYDLTYNPFFKNNNTKFILDQIKKSKKSKVLTFKENYNPFLNIIDIDSLSIQHSHMYNLINSWESSNEYFLENKNIHKKINAITEIV